MIQKDLLREGSIVQNHLYSHLCKDRRLNKPLFEVFLFYFCSWAPRTAIFIHLFISKNSLVHRIPINNGLNSPRDKKRGYQFYLSMFPKSGASFPDNKLFGTNVLFVGSQTTSLLEKASCNYRLNQRFLLKVLLKHICQNCFSSSSLIKSFERIKIMNFRL